MPGAGHPSTEKKLRVAEGLLRSRGCLPLAVEIGPFTSFYEAGPVERMLPAFAFHHGQLCLPKSPGVANALTSKLSAAQSDSDGGQIRSAINTENALLNQIQAQSRKHILAACTINGINLSPPLVLSNDVRNLIASLKIAGSADPVMGYVVDANDSGVSGVTISLADSSNTVVTTATTDGTGFYYFANTASLAPGAVYSVQVSSLPSHYTSAAPLSQTFTWNAAAVGLGNFVLN